MIRQTLAHLAIGLLCTSLPALSQARMQTIASAGAWSVSEGKADDGRNTCAAQAQGDGKLMRMAYMAGDNQITVQLLNTQWSGRAGLQVDLTAEFDRLGAWRTSARSFTTGDGTVGLQFNIPSAQIDPWVREFERSQHLVIRFPTQRAMSDWRVSLNGSDRVVMPLVLCMAAAIAA